MLMFGASAVLVIAAIGWLTARGVAAAPAGTFNPGSAHNLAYRGLNEIIAAATGDPGATAGNSIWELLNPGAVERERAAIYGTPAPQVVEPAMLYIPGAIGESPFQVGA